MEKQTSETTTLNLAKSVDRDSCRSCFTWQKPSWSMFAWQPGFIRLLPQNSRCPTITVTKWLES